MNKQTEALRMAKQHIIERKGGRGGAVCYVKSDEDVIKAIDEALEQPAQEYLTRAQQVIRANNSAQEPLMYGDAIHKGLSGACKPAQEPAAYLKKVGGYGIIDFAHIDEDGAYPVYTHPHQWQGLSLNEINAGRNKIENDEDIIVDDDGLNKY